jgi:hypothetical protein
MPERALGGKAYNESIFFNCPFDAAYKPIFDALVFAAFDCGYVPRCALETEDAGQVRIEKILKLIRSCKLGVHDISRTELDRHNRLPRFNMPFELGVFIGAARFGNQDQRHKVCLVLDRDPYRFQKFISDIAGQDIRHHGDDPEVAIRQLRDWLANLPRKDVLPGGGAIAERYTKFRKELPKILAKARILPKELIFADYTNIVSTWLSERPRPVKASRRVSWKRSLTP